MIVSYQQLKEENIPCGRRGCNRLFRVLGASPSFGRRGLRRRGRRLEGKERRLTWEFDITNAWAAHTSSARIDLRNTALVLGLLGHRLEDTFGHRGATDVAEANEEDGDLFGHFGGRNSASNTTTKEGYDEKSRTKREKVGIANEFRQRDDFSFNDSHRDRESWRGDADKHPIRTGFKGLGQGRVRGHGGRKQTGSRTGSWHRYESLNSSFFPSNVFHDRPLLSMSTVLSNFHSDATLLSTFTLNVSTDLAAWQSQSSKQPAAANNCPNFHPRTYQLPQIALVHRPSSPFPQTPI